MTETDFNKKLTVKNKQEPREKAIETVLFDQSHSLMNKVLQGKNGGIDARAFKKLIYERQAGSMAGPKNTLSSALLNAEKSEFLQDNVLLQGLKTFGISINQLLEANLANLEPGAYEPVKLRFKDQNEFVEKVTENLQSPVVRSLRSIVDVIKPKKYGIQTVSRYHSLPSDRKKQTFSSPSLSQLRGASSDHKGKDKLLDTVQEEDSVQPVKSGRSKGGLIAGDPRVPNITPSLQGETPLATSFMPESLQTVPEALEQDSEVVASQRKLGMARNYSMAGLEGQRQQAISPHGSANLGPHVVSDRNPFHSQLAIMNRSSSLNEDSQIIHAAMGLADELNLRMDENDRQKQRKTPFRHAQSSYQIQPSPSQQVLVIPPPDLEQLEKKNVSQEEYYEIYKNIIEKYQKKHRFGKQLTADPSELNQLTGRGYQIKAERYAMKRETKKLMKQRNSVLTGGPITVRGDPGYMSSESSSGTSRSSVSFGGVPEADLEHLADKKKRRQINKRRNQRRAAKWQIIFDEVVSVDVKNEISMAISQKAQHENSSALMDPSNLDKLSDGTSVQAPEKQLFQFAESQKNLKLVMEQMAERLKKRFLEDIDEEVPEEQYQEEKKLEGRNLEDTGSTFPARHPTSTGDDWLGGREDDLENIEQSINALMLSLVSDIQKDSETGAQTCMPPNPSAQPKLQTVPSFICNQSVYKSHRHQLAKRMNKFLRTVNTSPRFFDNDQEANRWEVKIGQLGKKGILALFPNNQRVESLKKLAEHLRSQNLISMDQAKNEVPKGFNLKMPLDRVTHAVGKHMTERSTQSKSQLPHIHPLEKLSPGQLTRRNGSPSAKRFETMMQVNLTPDPQSSGPNLGPLAKNVSQQVISQHQSDQLLQEVHSVIQYLANSSRLQVGSELSLEQQEETTENQLQGCITVERSNIQDYKLRKLRTTPPPILEQSPQICHCNNMAPHRHFYRSPSHQSRVDLVDGTTQVLSSEQHPPDERSALQQNRNTTKHSFSESKSITPPLMAPKTQITGTNWLKTNAAQSLEVKSQTKSNRDIIRELSLQNRDTVEVAGHTVEQASDSQLMINSKNAMETEELEEQKKSKDTSLAQSNRKGKTQTVLFKSDNKIVKLQQPPSLDQIGLMNIDERPAHTRLESARYQGPAVKEEKRAAKAVKGKQQMKIQHVTILQSLNPGEHRGEGNATKVQVSVKNIELPDVFCLSKQQSPQNSRIKDIALNMNQGVQTNFDTSHSFFKPERISSTEKEITPPVDRAPQPEIFKVQHQVLEPKAQFAQVSQPLLSKNTEKGLKILKLKAHQGQGQNYSDLSIQDEEQLELKNGLRQKGLMISGITASSQIINQEPLPDLNGEAKLGLSPQEDMLSLKRCIKVIQDVHSRGSQAQAMLPERQMVVDDYFVEAHMPNLYNHSVAAEPSIAGDTEGTAYGSQKGSATKQDKVRGPSGSPPQQRSQSRFVLNDTTGQGTLKLFPTNSSPKRELVIVKERRAEHIVRSFKPSKTKKLSQQQQQAQEQKLTQLADSNITPLGLFNQDLHAQREWNKLLALKHFNSTLQQKSTTVRNNKGAPPLFSQFEEANKTAQNRHGPKDPDYHAEDAYKSGPISRQSSQAERSAAEDKKSVGIHNDNSTMQSPDSQSLILEDQPNLTVVRSDAVKARKQSIQQTSAAPQTVLTKVPSRATQPLNKVIVFNFKGNQDLSSDLAHKGHPEIMKSQYFRNVSKHNHPSGSILTPANFETGIFSPKRNSLHDSVSIYAKAKASLVKQGADTHQGQQGPHGQATNTKDIVLSEERKRYHTTVKQRPDVGRNQYQATSLSQQNFLKSRRQNPAVNNHMLSNKLSPFKPIGGGFKQNLNIEVTPQRLLQEAAIAQDKLHLNNGWRNSRHTSSQTLDQASLNNLSDQNIGFSIEAANLNVKKGAGFVKRVIEKIEEDEERTVSSVTKHKIDRSGLSALDRVLNEYKHRERESDERRSQDDMTPAIDESIKFKPFTSRDSKSSTEYHPLMTHTQDPHFEKQIMTTGKVQNFQVPKGALNPQPVAEAIQTNDSKTFAKIKNSQIASPKRYKKQERTSTTFTKKESLGVPYPLKNHVIGEALHSSVNNSNPNQHFTRNGSPTHEATILRLSHSHSRTMAPPTRKTNPLQRTSGPVKKVIDSSIQA